MPDKQEEFEILLQLMSVNVTRFLIDDTDFEATDDFFNSLRTDIKNQYYSEVKDDTINLKSSYAFYNMQEDSKSIFIEIKVEFNFLVSPLEKLIHVEENADGTVKRNLVKNVLLTLVSIAYSTTRGILIEKLSNSRYDKKLILPMVDPNFLLTNFGE